MTQPCHLVVFLFVHSRSDPCPALPPAHFEPLLVRSSWSTRRRGDAVGLQERNNSLQRSPVVRKAAMIVTRVHANELATRS